MPGVSLRDHSPAPRNRKPIGSRNGCHWQKIDAVQSQGAMIVRPLILGLWKNGCDHMNIVQVIETTRIVDKFRFRLSQDGGLGPRL